MQDRNHRLRQRASIRATAAGNYLADAQHLLARNRPESAASLLYEAAKSSINAVANLGGDNPGYTDNKTRALQSIAAALPDGDKLLVGWESARTLHIHCDQHHLNDEEFSDSQRAAIAFVQQMLALFQQDSQP